jgi:hypothetical protein
MSTSGFFGALRQLGETIAFSLCKLNEMQFSAPWNPRGPAADEGGDSYFHAPRFDHRPRRA